MKTVAILLLLAVAGCEATSNGGRYPDPITRPIYTSPITGETTYQTTYPEPREER